LPEPHPIAPILRDKPKAGILFCRVGVDGPNGIDVPE
jgi:hypothetical protein